MLKGYSNGCRRREAVKKTPSTPQPSIATHNQVCVAFSKSTPLPAATSYHPINILGSVPLDSDAHTAQHFEDRPEETSTQLTKH
ncbi:hypothetical protein F2Q69_00036488 [Brassica cretica]|uniref:Uncharacterized protein n=1 Tax=Brassica cretica TaxID=69181 RepID=A0A8S9SUH4_BRACR|nr:hypothetical protein F2Q69_00036488 [Brassica cretica]